MSSSSNRHWQILNELEQCCRLGQHEKIQHITKFLTPDELEFVCFNSSLMFENIEHIDIEFNNPFDKPVEKAEAKRRYKREIDYWKYSEKEIPKGYTKESWAKEIEKELQRAKIEYQEDLKKIELKYQKGKKK